MPQVNIALEEISRLQVEGPSNDDVSTILEIEQRAHENGLQVISTKCSDFNSFLYSGT